jgi:hypothetical protein
MGQPSALAGDIAQRDHKGDGQNGPYDPVQHVRNPRIYFYQECRHR